MYASLKCYNLVEWFYIVTFVTFWFKIWFRIDYKDLLTFTDELGSSPGAGQQQTEEDTQNHYFFKKFIWINFLTSQNKFQSKIQKISKIQKFKISKIQNFKISKIQKFTISKIQKFTISKIQKFKISKNQNLKIQSLKITQIQNLKNSKSTNSKI